MPLAIKTNEIKRMLEITIPLLIGNSGCIIKIGTIVNARKTTTHPKTLKAYSHRFCLDNNLGISTNEFR